MPIRTLINTDRSPTYARFGMIPAIMPFWERKTARFSSITRTVRSKRATSSSSREHRLVGGSAGLIIIRTAIHKHRNCRSYNHKNGNSYAYVVTEGPDFKVHPGGIQIFKLGKNGVELVNTYVENFNSAHTIFIDTVRGLAFVNGSNWRGDVPVHHQDHKD